MLALMVFVWLYQGDGGGIMNDGGGINNGGGIRNGDDIRNDSDISNSGGMDITVVVWSPEGYASSSHREILPLGNNPSGQSSHIQATTGVWNVYFRKGVHKK